MNTKNTRFITTCAISIALTYLFTWVVRVPGPVTGGLVHLGNVPFFITSILLGPTPGAIAGAVGMGLFDITSGWGAWAPITIITGIIMGLGMGKITHKKFSFKKLMLAFIFALIIKVCGYYIGECIMYKSMAAPLASIPGNIIQILFASIIVTLIINPIKKALTSMHFDLNN